MDGNESRGVNLNGRRVRLLRKVRGEEREDFAARIGVSPGYVSHLENGIRKPSPTIFARICDALEVQDRTDLLLPDGEAGAA